MGQKGVKYGFRGTKKGEVLVDEVELDINRMQLDTIGYNYGYKKGFTGLLMSCSLRIGYESDTIGYDRI